MLRYVADTIYSGWEGNNNNTTHLYSAYTKALCALQRSAQKINKMMHKRNKIAQSLKTLAKRNALSLDFNVSRL